MLGIKYQIRIEFRYTVPSSYIDSDTGETIEDKECKRHTISSELIDDLDEAVKRVNDLIANNRWIEQFPGYKGSGISKKFRLERVMLKNNTEIYFEVKTINLMSMAGMEQELLKFKEQE